ncbi:hypothetical protein I7I50_11642 [Histoplasma capsulatum G186AR]|uniref:Uncharacterized protein n=1 Tax=Ajellomyces capsulatus TaxID=5037 RepID=A0A8H8D843_AJECA|nr:hypothetical protein I7I52_02879 [Histoplasma capsulatum]QSS70117.1 hypothetical protein I7I50_11642 [Histoplasma capsulatum G186AR]
MPLTHSITLNIKVSDLVFRTALNLGFSTLNWKSDPTPPGNFLIMTTGRAEFDRSVANFEIQYPE